MLKQFTYKEYICAKSTQKLPIKCLVCSSIFHTTKYRIKCRPKLKGRRNDQKYGLPTFCSFSCAKQYRNRKRQLILSCTNCNKVIKKAKSTITENNFCSQSCSAIYNNANKEHGTRISKIEKFIQVKLLEDFKNIIFHFNNKLAIKSELDIYIPELLLAFEINGVFHYKPIYGFDKLQKIKNNDIKKEQLCNDAGINLIVINCLNLKKFTEIDALPYYKSIKEIICGTKKDRTLIVKGLSIP